MDIIKINYNQKLIDSREIYNKLEVKTKYTTWISRIIQKYSFIENVDFVSELGESIGGRRAIIYYVTIHMAKELCMLDNSEKGRNVRKAYIFLEENYKKNQLTRLAGIETRKTLTDKIKDAGENERMHGHGYSNYTKLVYKLCGIEYKKIENFRNTLTTDELSRVETVEKMTDALLSMGRQYDEIKNTLSQIITQKEIES